MASYMGCVPNPEPSTAAFPAESKAPGQSSKQKEGKGEDYNSVALLFHTELGGVCLLS
ncbi:hypothetical protein I79_000814 [Cricetulus griseus]|uniref:Uncharacterized protein n=1 Tax=Cricetulus griseus TaxID=10029 RepID=G3GT40_CRIGR|nr:hypothetical protein I79_000814 [Cricetulus griseus]